MRVYAACLALWAALLVLLVAAVGRADPAPLSLGVEFGADPRGGKQLGLVVSGPVPVHDLLVFDVAAGTYNAVNFAASPPGWYATAALGAEVRGDWGGYLRATVGPAYVSRDAPPALSGRLQWRLAVGAGLEDPETGRVGIAYRHLSNGGRVAPNRGADYVGLEVSVYFRGL